MNKEQLYQRVGDIYYQCSLIIRESLGTVPSTAGNVAIFCQTEDEYTKLTHIANQLVRPSDNPAQKYFQLVEPITIDATGEAPATTLSWLYIRKPAEDSPESGDVDYVLTQADYDKLKDQVKNGSIKGASIYERPGWDMVEFRSQDYNGLPYVSVEAMVEKVRVRF